MESYIKNIQTLSETLAVCEKGYYMYNEKRIDLILNNERMKKSIVFTDKQVKNIPNTKSIGDLSGFKNTCFLVYDEDSFEAAKRLVNEDTKPLVLNFANPVSPGGGVRRGASAQEEDLCRKSTLLLSLESENAREYYSYHSKNDPYISSDYMIISPEVEVFRDSDGSLIEKPYIVSVLTCAAPIYGGNVLKMSNGKYEELLYNRICGMLYVAVEQGYRNLVLGAWGCGAFGNDAKVVAKLFDKAFCNMRQKYEGNLFFKNVIMAVLDRSESRYNYKAFENCFGVN